MDLKQKSEDDLGRLGEGRGEGEGRGALGKRRKRRRAGMGRIMEYRDLESGDKVIIRRQRPGRREEGVHDERKWLGERRKSG